MIDINYPHSSSSLTQQNSPSESGDQKIQPNYIAITLIMGLLGTFFWAIRGTGGFGGSGGGLYAGLGWGLLWFVFSNLSGYRGRLSTPWMVVAITLGIAYGGMTGYGLYIGWLRGEYMLNGSDPSTLRSISPWTGYAMLFICGLQWGGVTGAFMAWCQPIRQMEWWHWLTRLACGGLGAWIMLWCVESYPQFFLPFYEEGVYADEKNSNCLRAARTIKELAPHIGFFLGFLAFEVMRRDWKAVGLILTMSLGFALPFCIGGYWQTFYSSPIKLGWWKYWEMTIGLFGGLSFGLAFYWFHRPSAEAARTYNKGSYILGAGCAIWLAYVKSWICTYNGVSSLHGWAETAAQYRTLFASICLLLVTLFFVRWMIVELQVNFRSAMAMLVWLLAVGTLMHHLPPWGGLGEPLYSHALIFLPAASLSLGYFLTCSRRSNSGWKALTPQNPISSKFVGILLGSMLLMGLVDSIPIPMNFNNILLIGLYLVCIIVSITLWHRARFSSKL